MPADAIRSARHGLGLSQRQLARALGVSLRALQHWEAAGAPRTRATMIGLALRALAA